MTANIANIRSIVFENLLKLVYSYIDRFLTDDNHACKAESYNTKECDSIVLGSLLKGLQKLKLFPERPTPASLTCSVKSFVLDLTNLEIFTYPEVRDRRRSLGSHEVCNISVEIRQSAESIVEDMPSPLLESHREHLRIQNQKCEAKVSRRFFEE